MYLHYNYILITLQCNSKISLELLEQLYCRNNQLMVVVNDYELMFQLRQKHPKAKIILGDLTDTNSIQQLIQKCRDTFPIFDMLIHIDFLECALTRFIEPPIAETIRSNYIKLTNGVLPKIDNRTPLTLILSHVLDPLESKLKLKRIEKKPHIIHQDYLSGLDNNQVQIHTFPIPKLKEDSNPEKIVEKFIGNLIHDRLRNENEPFRAKKKNLLSLISTILKN